MIVSSILARKISNALPLINMQREEGYRFVLVGKVVAGVEGQRGCDCLLKASAFPTLQRRFNYNELFV
jgi:hypothetical protein